MSTETMITRAFEDYSEYDTRNERAVVYLTDEVDGVWCEAETFVTNVPKGVLELSNGESMRAFSNCVRRDVTNESDLLTFYSIYTCEERLIIPRDAILSAWEERTEQSV